RAADPGDSVSAGVGDDEPVVLKLSMECREVDGRVSNSFSSILWRLAETSSLEMDNFDFMSTRGEINSANCSSASSVCGAAVGDTGARVSTIIVLRRGDYFPPPTQLRALLQSQHRCFVFGIVPGRATKCSLRGFSSLLSYR
ncbi:hypothetical protein THAOC_27409, partial [Thalassiosira oceanica]